MEFFVDDAFARNKKYFSNQLSEYVFYSKYSKWRDDLGRREVWEETVQRSVDYLIELSRGMLSREDYQRIHQAILSMDVMPSGKLATTVKAMATNAVAPYDVPLVKVGAKATSTTVTLTACVAVPATLLAVKVNVRTPMSPASGV